MSRLLRVVLSKDKKWSITGTIRRESLHSLKINLSCQASARPWESHLLQRQSTIRPEVASLWSGILLSELPNICRRWKEDKPQQTCTYTRMYKCVCVSIDNPVKPNFWKLLLYSCLLSVFLILDLDWFLSLSLFLKKCLWNQKTFLLALEYPKKMKRLDYE